MKTQKEREAAIGAITEAEQQRFKAALIRLEELKAIKELTEESLRDLCNVCEELYMIKESWTSRYINLLKQGYEVN